MLHHPTSLSRRRGAVAPLAAILLVPLLAMIAFAVDLGYLVQVKTELQHTADAAALAGAQALQQPYTLWVVPTADKAALRAAAISAAKTAAKNYASYNRAGNRALTLLDSDIECGFLDANGTYTASPASNQYPNTVRVIVRRDSNANTPVSLFFAPVLGASSVNMQATARATIYTGTITTFRNVPGFNGGLLPMTYDVDHWDGFVRTGQDPDGNESHASDGTPQVKVYPSVKYKGNFGQLALDDEHAGSSEIRSWIDDGVPPGTFDLLTSRGLLPLPRANPTTDWLGDPGFKASTAMAVNDHQGERYILPLYKAVNPGKSNGDGYEAGSGSGSKYNYNIVRFVPIRIMYTNQTNREILVQPSGHTDSNATFDPTTLAPAGSRGETLASSTTFTTPKLTE